MGSIHDQFSYLYKQLSTYSVTLLSFVIQICTVVHKFISYFENIHMLTLLPIKYANNSWYHLKYHKFARNSIDIHEQRIFGL